MPEFQLSAELRGHEKDVGSHGRKPARLGVDIDTDRFAP